MKKLVIAVDFDGCIVESGWPNIGNAKPGAIQTIQRWFNHGHKIIIWTCRTGEPLQNCIEWLGRNHVPYHAINANLPERIKAFGGDTRKVSADVYVDDRGIGMRKVDNMWDFIRREVNRISME